MALKKKNNGNADFENVVLLIQQARTRAFAKVNEELVMLYYNAGSIVSQKVAAGSRGEGTVNELAKYSELKIPGLHGFNRRGMYRMKQFYEAYAIDEFISPAASYLKTYLNNTVKSTKVSALPTQSFTAFHEQIVATMLTQVMWSELKMQELEPEFSGKLNFYLEALGHDVKKPHKKPGVGILLCKGKDNEVVEYAMARNTAAALIADYETKLIPKKILANKPHQLLEQLSIKNA
ncbi:MAG TPA: PDDEXK nuclease domain-containing protein [Parafilimonas sp.]|nr:PDDEXK nuclease domain-containing protein [Parafilimonas sp.]